MASPLHDYLRWDAAGEGEADEGTTAGMGADEFVFGLCAFLSLSGPIGYAGDGRIELANFAEILQVVIHLLVGDNRKGSAIGEALVFIFGQDLLGERIEIDGEPVVGFLGGDVHGILDDVSALKVSHIGVAQAGEGAEAEHVP